MRLYLITAIVMCLLPFASVAAQPENASSWTPPNKLCSADGSCCVQIVDTVLAGKSVNGRIAADYPDQEERTLAVFAADGRLVAQYPTTGYLLSAFWSPNNAHVAVNNRRANAGDYLWVFSLPDGAAIKVPEDLAPKQERAKLAANNRNLMKEITRRYPKCTKDTMRKVWLTASGWKSANELMVKENFYFDLFSRWSKEELRFKSPGFPAFFTVSETYRISAGKLERLPLLDIRRVPELTD